MKEFTVNQKTSLKDFTDSVYPQGSFAYSRLIRDRDIRVNGVKTSKNIALNVGDKVAYYTSAKEEARKTHSVIFSDENVYIADKYSGVSSEGLLSELGEGYYLVHRLDRNTAGAMVFAKNSESEAELLRAFREKRMQKTYLCLCKNCFKKKSEYLTAFLVKDERLSTVKIYNEQISGSARIETEYKVLKSCGDYALVEVALHTGKTHQIRAHMAYIGCPVLGDEKYGDEILNKKYGVKRQILVAKILRFNTEGCLKYLSGKSFESGFTAELKTRS